MQLVIHLLSQIYILQLHLIFWSACVCVCLHAYLQMFSSLKLMLLPVPRLDSDSRCVYHTYTQIYICHRINKAPCYRQYYHLLTTHPVFPLLSPTIYCNPTTTIRALRNYNCTTGNIVTSLLCLELMYNVLMSSQLNKRP